MTQCDISAPQNALIIFVDVIDSSIYSSIFGLDKYARKIDKFQKLFEELGKLYFCDKPYFKEPINALCQVSARGDEGQVFLVDPQQSGFELVYKSVKFVTELKARLKILNLKDEEGVPPQELKIAAGIHYDKVSLVMKTIEKNGNYRRIIDKIIGYTINYAKRVESISRIGNFSQIFLSKKAAELLFNSPIVLFKHTTSLKGISSSEDLFEINSTFLDDIPLIKDIEVGNTKYEEILDYCINYIGKSELEKEKWLNSFIISVLTTRLKSISGDTQKQDYSSIISKLAWKNPIESDPILLCFRAKECEDHKKYTRALSYYKLIMEKYPSFIYARVKNG